MDVNAEQTETRRRSRKKAILASLQCVLWWKRWRCKSGDERKSKESEKLGPNSALEKADRIIVVRWRHIGKEGVRMGGIHKKRRMKGLVCGRKLIAVDFLV